MPAAMSTALNAWRPPASGSCSGGRGGAAAAVHSGEARIRVWSGAGLARALALRWRRARVCSPPSCSAEGAHASRLLQYPTSVELLTRALDAEGPFSALGGEIQLWLALGLQVSVRGLLLPEDTGLPGVEHAGRCAGVRPGAGVHRPVQGAGEHAPQRPSAEAGGAAPLHPGGASPQAAA